MRDTERDPLRLVHMLEAARNIKDFMDGKSLDDLINNKILFFAVVKNIEIIGEAAFMLSKDFKSKHKEISWKVIAGMRHVLVHDYYKISPIEVYNVYRKDLDELILNLEILHNLYKL